MPSADCRYINLTAWLLIVYYPTSITICNFAAAFASIAANNTKNLNKSII